jgi:uncharacterized protein YyaL (SSP411 family)
VLVRADAGSEHAERLAAVLPWAAGQGPGDGRPTAFVCRDFACERPVTDPADLVERLAGR